MHWSQTESSKCSLECLSSNLRHPFRELEALPSYSMRVRFSWRALKAFFQAVRFGRTKINIGNLPARVRVHDYIVAHFEPSSERTHKNASCRRGFREITEAGGSWKLAVSVSPLTIRLARWIKVRLLKRYGHPFFVLRKRGDRTN